MKYLKKFNESSNEYYTSQKFSIVGDDVILYDNDGTLIKKYKLESFTEPEIVEIDNIILSRLNAKRFENPWAILSLSYNYLENYRYTLLKSEDEWYFIAIQNVKTHEWLYYKCDQYDGLLKLLKEYNPVI